MREEKLSQEIYIVHGAGCYIMVVTYHQSAAF